MNILSDITLFDKSNLIFAQNYEDEYMIKYNESMFVTTKYTTRIDLIDVKVVTKYYNTDDVEFDTEKNYDIIQQLQKVEREILKEVRIENKTPKYDLVSTGKLKICTEKNKLNSEDDMHFSSLTVMLRIQSIWQTADNYGLYYRFYI
jgi:hypothetical protein